MIQLRFPASFSFIFIITLIFLEKTTAQYSPTVNITKRAQLNVNLNGAANICGYAAGGREYALVGERAGTSIVDVTDPDNPVFIVRIGALNSIWREIKVYQNYAYVTTEATGQGLQIIDLTNLPATTLSVKNYLGGDGDLINIERFHSLHIDVANGFLYGFGGNSTVNVSGTPQNVDGAIVLNISDPWNPTYAGKFTANYIHDGFVADNTLYSSNIQIGSFSIINFTNKAAPVVLSTRTTPTTFTHNTWRSDDGKYIFTTDENAGSFLASYDVSDPANIQFLDKIRSPSGAAAIVHNTHYLNGYAITSWYTEGVTIVDAHRPQNLVQVGQYDTYNGTGAIFKGCWGVYPYLPSGNLIASTLEGDLFVLTPQYQRACYLEGQVTDAATGLPLSNASIVINSTDANKNAASAITGNYYTGQVTPGTVSATYSKPGYLPQTITGIVLSNGNVVFQNVQLVAAPLPVELLYFNALGKEKTVELEWATASEILTSHFDVERSADSKNYVNIGTIKAASQPNNYIFTDQNPNALNYYRLKINDADGKFVYSKTVSVQMQKDVKWGVFPTNTEGVVYVTHGSKDQVDVQVFNALGAVVRVQKANSETTKIDLTALSAGIYIVQIRTGNDVFSQKIIKH